MHVMNLLLVRQRYPASGFLRNCRDCIIAAVFDTLLVHVLYQNHSHSKRHMMDMDSDCTYIVLRLPSDCYYLACGLTQPEGQAQQTPRRVGQTLELPKRSSASPSPSVR